MNSLKIKLFAMLLSFVMGNWPSISLAMNEAPPKVAVSITPFYALVAAIMQGVGTPQLLVSPGSSPHQYVLKPKEIKLLKQADLIFWGGPELETFLVKSLHNIEHERPCKTRVIQLGKTMGLMLLPIRHSAAWDPHEHHNHSDHSDHSDHHHYSAQNVDMHFWLDTNNAMVIADTIVHSLLTVDPKHAALYRKNGEALKHRLIALDYKIRQKLEPLKTVPFIVFHDAYQYFEHQYGLKGVGSITLHPEVPPSAKRLHTIRSIIVQTKAKCVFTEPQFQPKLVQSITENLPVKMGELDPIGNKTENNPDGYFKLLEDLTDSMYSCLK